MGSGIIRIGTCSWTQKSLIESGAFYPPEASSAEERLNFYASHFDTVEVDSSYYAIPTPKMARAWVERTPDNFLFHLKAYGALTGHSIDPGLLTKDNCEFLPGGGPGGGQYPRADPAALRGFAQAMVAALEPLKAGTSWVSSSFSTPPGSPAKTPTATISSTARN